MKSVFKGYYAPSEEEFGVLWKEGLIVLDTNVLLDLYRLPASARDELLSVLELLKERLWIPYQVALEFQRRRLTVIASERKASEEALSEATDLFEEVQKIVISLQIDKRGLDIESQPLLDGLKVANDKLIAAIDAVHKSQLDIAVSDPVRDKLDSLLYDKIGSAPADQAALDVLAENGDSRYINKIPPGYADADKDKNPNEAAFFHEGLKYERKFGDLILWRQLLHYAREKKVKAVLLVTADRKEDWWWREKGKTIGPRPELAAEMHKIAGVDLFWMYSSVQFLANAESFTQADVSEESVTELEEVVRLGPTEMPARREETNALTPRDSDYRRLNVLDFVRVERAVLKWLTRRFDIVSTTRGFPDFIVETAQGLHGYEVKYTRNFSRLLFSPSVVNAMLRGYVEVSEGRLSSITIIMAVDEEEISSVYGTGRAAELEQRIDNLLQKYPVDEIIVGYVDDAETFVPVTKRGGMRAQRIPDWLDEA